MTNDPISQPRRPSTSPPAPGSGSGKCIKWAVVGWILAITAFHLGSAAAGHSIFRDIHLGTALEYAKGSINLFKPIVVGFNLNNTPTPQELPLWQALTGFVFKFFGAWFGWANLVSLVLMFSSLYPLFKIAQRFAGEHCAWWTILLFLAQPLVFIYAGEASPDGMSLALAIWFTFCASRIWDEPNLKWLVLTGLTGALAALSKLPFFMAAGLGVFFMTLTSYRQRKAVWVYLGVAALFSGVVFLAWTRYQNYVYRQAELPLVDMKLSGNEAAYWYFGDLKYRLSPAVWVKGGWRILTSLFGSFALVALLLLGFMWKPITKLGYCWLAGAVVTTLIFFHMVLTHSHYYLMFVPGVAIICATVAARLEGLLFAEDTSRRRLTWPVIIAALFLSTVQGVLGAHVIYHFDQYPYVMANLIKQHTVGSPGTELEFAL